jgi:hypothetical protein
MYIDVYMYDTCVCVYMCLCVYTHTHTHMYTYTCTHTHMYIYIQYSMRIYIYNEVTLINAHTHTHTHTGRWAGVGEQCIVLVRVVLGDTHVALDYDEVAYKNLEISHRPRRSLLPLYRVSFTFLPCVSVLF